MEQAQHSEGCVDELKLEASKHTTTCLGKPKEGQAVMVHAFNPSTREAEAGEFKTSLVYTASSRTDSKAIEKLHTCFYAS